MEIDLAESRKLIKTFSFRVMRRVPVSIISRDDVEQELWIAWCQARDNFKPEMGVPFGAYFWKTMNRHINRVLERTLWRFKEQTFALSLDYKDDSGDGAGLSLGETIASSDKTAAQVAEGESNYQDSLRNLSDRSALFVRLLREQPVQLVAEVMLAEDKAEFAKKIGAPYAKPNHITSTLVFDLMGASNLERTKIIKEVRKVAKRASA